MSNLPNFLIVGTAKGATTTIHEYLKQHPNIFMTENKEPCFFLYPEKETPKFSTHKKNHTKLFVNSFNEYKELFETSDAEVKIKGESSTPYLYFHNDTIKNIKNYISNYSQIKILIVLRNPVERAYSQYMMKRRDLKENLSFSEAIAEESNRIKQNYHFDYFYTNRGLYYNQVKDYLDNFSSVKIVLFEEFKKDSNKILNEITEFLELPEFDFKKINNKNVSGLPKSKGITNFINNSPRFFSLSKRLIPDKLGKNVLNYIRNKNLKKGESINLKDRETLMHFYKNDINKLEKLINRDLSNWYK